MFDGRSVLSLNIQKYENRNLLDFLSANNFNVQKKTLSKQKEKTEKYNSYSAILVFVKNINPEVLDLLREMRAKHNGAVVVICKKDREIKLNEDKVILSGADVLFSNAGNPNVLIAYIKSVLKRTELRLVSSATSV